MPALPPEILLRILAHVTTTKEFYNRIPLVCRQFAQLQESARKSSTTYVTVAIHSPHSSAANIVRFPDLELAILSFLPAEERHSQLSSLRKKILPNLRMNLVLTDSGSVESITSVIQNALDAAIPFGSVKVSTMSVQSPFHVDQTVLLANVLQPHTIVFDLAEAFSPEAALFNALPWHWSRHALATLCVPGIRVLNIPLSSLYLFPNVVHFSTGTRTHGRVKDASTFRPQPKFDTGVDVLQKLETLYMGALDLLAPDSLMNLEAAIGEGRFPRLRKVYVTYYTGDLGEDDADEPPVPSLLCDLAHLHSAFPTVSVTVMIRTRSDMQRFHELYINKAHAGSLQGVDVVLGREMQVVVESSVPGGTVRIWRRT